MRYRAVDDSTPRTCVGCGQEYKPIRLMTLMPGGQIKSTAGFSGAGKWCTPACRRKYNPRPRLEAVQDRMNAWEVANLT
jgi:hypothetical protein